MKLWQNIAVSVREEDATVFSMDEPEASEDIPEAGRHSLKRKETNKITLKKDS